MWQDALTTAAVISTDATGAMIQPEKRADGQRQACKKGHFFTAVVDCDHVLFAYAERHTQDAVRKLFGSFKGFLAMRRQQRLRHPRPWSAEGRRRSRRLHQVGRVLGALPALFSSKLPSANTQSVSRASCVYALFTPSTTSSESCRQPSASLRATSMCVR